MSYESLIRSLEQKVDTELTQLREHLSEQYEEERHRHDRQRAKRLEDERRRRWEEAEGEWRSRRRAAHHAASTALENARNRLLQRLWDAAVAHLPELASENRAELFAQLAEELPRPTAWTHLQVHPEDVARAQALFPQAQVEADASVLGGIVARAEDRSLQVDNSLPTRLKRAWPELSAAMLAELEGHDGDLG